jgi:phosphohistidine phosphatase SixA/8-oxo-dGTP pyrophosphatase MutT (NUDIX family)
VSDITIAAGGVVWRRQRHTVQVALVHRARYDDWSLPKGKPHGKEALISCAYREILEETGLSVRLGPYIGEVEYLAIDGQKRVSYWCAQALDSDRVFQPNNEVDELEWHTLEEALARLSQKTNVEILSRFIAMDYDVTPLVILRHAKAVDQRQWQGGDEDRPLDSLGQQQARRMPSIYQVYALDEIHVSDAIRCYDTITGMARILGVHPIISNDLSEYTFEKNKEKALSYGKDLVTKVIKDEKAILLCSHNPILARILEKVTKNSDVDLPVSKLQPGEAWIVFFKKKKASSIELVSAPAV